MDLDYNRLNACNWHAYATMLLPIFKLMICSAIFNHLALAASQPDNRSVRAWYPRMALGTACALRVFTTADCSIVEAHCAFNPITHLPRPGSLPSTWSSVFRCFSELEYRRSLDPASREANHLTVVLTSGVGASARKVKINLFGRNPKGIRE